MELRNLWDDLIFSWRLPYCDGIYVVDSCILIGKMEGMGDSEAERYKKKKSLIWRDRGC